MSEELIARLEKATGPDRDLDADIAEQILGWKPARLGPDYDGENACEILTPNGKLYDGGFQYPPKGRLHRGYHAPQFTREIPDAFRLAQGGLEISPPFTALTICIAALRARAQLPGD